MTERTEKVRSPSLLPHNTSHSKRMQKKRKHFLPKSFLCEQELVYYVTIESYHNFCHSSTI